MRRIRIVRVVPVLALACVLGALAGCGKQPGYERFIPSDDAARTALEAALEAWKTDQPVGKITSVNPPVDVTDSVWRDGQKLDGYQIIKEEEGGKGPKAFSVELTMKNSGEKQVVRYWVLGSNPLMVYRDEDYQKLSGQ